MLLIPEPPHYNCESDEDHFFAWLKAVPAVKKIRGTPSGLELTLDEPVDKLSFYDLVGLMTRYGLDRRCLRVLCQANPDPWFRDNKNYWHEAVFSDPPTRAGAMTWYAASIVIAMRISGDDTAPISIYENVVLIEAPTPTEAMSSAGQIGAQDAANDDGLTIGGKPAVREFAGIRKLITVSNPWPLNLDQDRPVSGTEITYSEFTVPDQATLRRLAAGEAVIVAYEE